MKKHTKVYLKAMGYAEGDFIPCEICGGRAVDIHHIRRRGMGGNPNADTIENLMALCRHHHDEFGDKPQWVQYLKDVHEHKIKGRG